MVKELNKYSAFIIGYLSITSYYLAYQYKRGYLLYFKVPEVFISNVEFIDIIRAMTGIVGFISIGSYIWFFGNKNNKNTNTWIGRLKKNTLLISILLLLGGYFYEIQTLRIASSVFIFSILIYNLVFPLIFSQEIKGYNNKIAYFFKGEVEKSFNNILRNTLNKHFTLFILLIVLFTYGLGSFVTILAYQNASENTRFDTAVINEEAYILFPFNDEKVIASRYEENVLSNEFEVIFKENIVTTKREIADLKVTK